MSEVNQPPTYHQNQKPCADHVSNHPPSTKELCERVTRAVLPKPTRTI